ncbi:hypothetical protein AGMMS50276_33000 [Synergistales bacterium]|nr:hypothetical protein AGMMS50276_33000 [Synergistales bacterium]
MGKLKMRKCQEGIRNSKSLTPEQKRVKMDALDKEMSELARKTLDRYYKMKNK